MSRGKFIVHEGIDGGGKGVQTDRSVEMAKPLQLPTSRWAFPRRSHPSGKLAIDYLQGTYGPKEANNPYITSVFFAYDRKAAAPEIEELLASGVNVMCERYVDSNAAYQATNIPDPAARKAFVDWLYDFEYIRLGIPQPDLVIFLDVDVITADGNVTKRGLKKEITEGDLPWLTRVIDNYREIAKRPGHVTVDCMETDTKMFSIDAIHKMVWGEILKIL